MCDANIVRRVDEADVVVGWTLTHDFLIRAWSRLRPTSERDINLGALAPLDTAIPELAA